MDSCEYDEIGGLLIIIGPNNLGKTNLLNALSSFFNNKKINLNRDKFIDSSIEINNKNISFSLNIENKSNFLLKKIDNNDYIYELKERKQKDLLNFLEKYTIKLSNFSNKIKNNSVLFYRINGFLESINKMLIKLKESNNIKSLIEDFEYYIYYNENPETELDKLFFTFYKELNKYLFFDVESLKSNFLGDNKFNIIPKCYEYRNEDRIRSSNLLSNYNDFPNIFFKNLFKIINVDPKIVIDKWNISKSLNNKGFMRKMEEEINKKLCVINNDFNNLYSFSNSNYKFEIILSDEEIYLNILKNSEPVVLDLQSEGFNWFFSLYFNVLSSNELNKGDIIIIDEPGIHLHVNGQIELRNFLKKFSIEKNVLIIITTHSPFMIDIDNLDEIRVLRYSDANINTVEIENGFWIYNPNCLNKNDSIEKIKRSLTINNNVLFADEAKIVFVEGITDYNYLTTFKNNLPNNEKYKNIYFVPISGLGKIKEIDLTIKNISNIFNRKTYLLTDSDYAGKEIKKNFLEDNKKITLIQLDEIDPNFIDIESLFSNEIEKEFYNKIKSKDSFWTSIFKNFFNKFNLDIKTIQNFTNLLNYILDI